ncbi:uncharacterized protein LOC129592948 [Paramacrobiotus metropolitanus]|uniref:uncharacterized protein LOC129592948 n=1 Tax=Paramacrobiotus metropolitanus TaxID=2943436 RepID=UPI00244656AF|nr:uncharacterized protein LOC129592948 [Paramacrobiotus metropolitanus]
MANIKKAVCAFLNKRSAWVYQEMLMEAVIVLWFSSQIAMKMGSRFLPEWQDSRVNRNAVTDLDQLIHFFGYNVSGCLWDRIAAPWNNPRMSKLLDDCAISPAMETEATFGYTGTFLTLAMTYIVAASIVCSAFINRHWSLPSTQQHFSCCKKISMFFGFGVSTDDYMAECFYCSASWIIDSIFLWVSSLFLGVLWLVIVVLPVVIMAGCVVTAIIVLCGEVAVFPCCITTSCVLSVHCTGRLWGFWMNETYLSYIIRTLRDTCGVQLLLDRSGRGKKTQLRLPSAPRKQYLLRMCVLTAGSTAVAYNVCYKLFLSFPHLGYRRFDAVELNDCCDDSNAKGLEHIPAIVSYWVDSKAFTAGHVDGLLELSPFARTTGLTFLFWSATLSIVSCLISGCMVLRWIGFLLFWTPISCFVVCKTKCYSLFGLKKAKLDVPDRPIDWLDEAERSYDAEAQRHEAQAFLQISDNSADASYREHYAHVDCCEACAAWMTANYAADLTGPVDISVLRGRRLVCYVCRVLRLPPDILELDMPCACNNMTKIVCVSFVGLKELLFWTLLPLPVSQCVVPESWQLPILLTILTTYTAFIFGQYWESLRDWWRHKVEEKLEDKILWERVHNLWQAIFKPGSANYMMQGRDPRTIFVMYECRTVVSELQKNAPAPTAV